MGDYGKARRDPNFTSGELATRLHGIAMKIGYTR